MMRAEMGHGLPQHIVKRAQGGSDVDLDNLVALCRACHDQTDAPFSKSRLVVRGLGAGIFTFDLVHAVSKWDARRAMAGTEDEPKSTPAATSSPLARSSQVSRQTTPRSLTEGFGTTNPNPKI